MIESETKRRLADEYDAAQERGELAAGRPKKSLPDENSFQARVGDIGPTSKQIHEARQIRDAEKASPGIVTLLKAGCKRGRWIQGCRQSLLCNRYFPQVAGSVIVQQNFCRAPKPSASPPELRGRSGGLFEPWAVSALLGQGGRLAVL